MSSSLERFKDLEDKEERTLKFKFQKVAKIQIFKILNFKNSIEREDFPSLQEF